MGHVGADFGGLLKAMREARRISQSKLAERADFDHSYVSRLESGARMPTRDAVERLASALTLAQSEEDGLLAAAGFLPRDVSSLLSDEPVLGEVLDLLQNDSRAGRISGQHPPGAAAADRAGAVRGPAACSERPERGCGLTVRSCRERAANASASDGSFRFVETADRPSLNPSCRRPESVRIAGAPLFRLDFPA